MSTPALLAALLLSPLQVSTDTLTVRADADPPEGPDLQPFEEVRVGSLARTDGTAFGLVIGVVATEDGSLYVADTQVPAIRMFDVDGVHVGDVGRQGEGPGEFRGLNAIAMTPEGEIAAWDYTAHRLSVFAGDRAYLRSFRTPDVAGLLMGPGPALVVDTAGRFWIRTFHEFPRTPGAPEVVYSWVRYSPRGEIIDSIVPPRRRLGGSLAAFKIETVNVLSPGAYFVSGRKDEYAVHRPLSDGRIVRIERGYAPVPLVGQERSQWEAFLAEWERRWNFDSPDLPRHKPVWRSLFVDADSRIWVARHGVAEHREGYVSRRTARGQWPNVDWVEPTAYDLLGPRGSFLGSATFPDGAQVVFARGRHVWTLESGELDEQYVVRYAIRTGG